MTFRTWQTNRQIQTRRRWGEQKWNESEARCTILCQQDQIFLTGQLQRTFTETINSVLIKKIKIEHQEHIFVQCRKFPEVHMKCVTATVWWPRGKKNAIFAWGRASIVGWVGPGAWPWLVSWSRKKAKWNWWERADRPPGRKRGRTLEPADITNKASSAQASSKN